VWDASPGFEVGFESSADPPFPVIDGSLSKVLPGWFPAEVVVVPGAAWSRAADPPSPESGRVLYVKYAAGLRGTRMGPFVTYGGGPLESLEAASAIVLVTVTTFSVQDVRVKFPEPETQLVEVDVTTMVHSSGLGV
jgi:hypothetical protein